MKEQKEFVVYYNESKNLIGYRERHFDWEEGEDIMTNGVKTTVFGIFDGTDKNMELAHYMIVTLKKHEPHYKRVVYAEGVKNVADYIAAIEEGRIPKIKCETLCTTKRVWKDFDAKLDFIDNVMAEMD